MNARENKWKLGALARPVMLLPALVVALSVTFTGAASAQTTFQADVSANGPAQPGPGGPHTPCANGAFSCGTANIADYGVASWNLFLDSNTNVQTSCGSTYTATTDFTLLSDPASMLVLNEGGYLCAPGLNANGYFKEGANAFGFPYTAFGTWTIDTADSTGVFGTLQGGSGTGGTDTLYYAGAHAAGSYSGMLG